MLRVGGAVDQLRLFLFGMPEHVPHVQQPDHAPLGTLQSHRVSQPRAVRDPERDRERPGQSTRQAHLVQHAHVVRAIHEAREGTVRPRGQEPQVRDAARVEGEGGQPGRLRQRSAPLLALEHALHQYAAVRRDRRDVTAHSSPLTSHVFLVNVCSPHSVLPLPLHRPARSGSPGAVGRVHGQQPMLA